MFFVKSDVLIKNVNKIKKYINKRKTICFLDLEGTQFSHECIAIGALLAKIDKDGFIKETKKPFKIYVQPKNIIGRYVEGLTGITPEIISKLGVSFSSAVSELKKNLGIHFKSSLYMTYGNHDMVIINSSIQHNIDSPIEDLRYIQKNHCDFHNVFQQYVRDDKNNSLSLIHACEMFDCLSEGKHHDPTNDAINLANLYNAFLKRKDIVFERYKLILANCSSLPNPIQAVIKKLLNDENVTPSDFEKEIKKELK